MYMLMYGIKSSRSSEEQYRCEKARTMPLVPFMANTSMANDCIGGNSQVWGCVTTSSRLTCYIRPIIL
jgi:hypothetical protein